MTLQDHDINSTPCVFLFEFFSVCSIVGVCTCCSVSRKKRNIYFAEMLCLWRWCVRAFWCGVSLRKPNKTTQFQPGKPIRSVVVVSGDGVGGGDDDDDNGAYYCNKNDITYEPIGDNE